MKNLIAIMLLILLGSAYAQSPPQDLKGSRINLDARASEEVDNDVMRAALFVEMEDVDAAKLAEKVNQATNDALKIAKGFTGLRTKTTGYSTYPVTDNNKIVRWRSRSEISVEGEDFRRMTDAIGKLQAVMQLGAVSFSVSPAKRAKVEDGLTQSAIAEFLRKAEAATKGFKGARYNLLEATISADGGNMPPPRPMVMMKSVSSSDVPAPDFEAGSSRITVTVNGAILIPR
jgi:predicted secreted protein